MTLQQIIGGGCCLVFVGLSLIQITPIKINPWSAIFGCVGRAVNGEVVKKLDALQTDVSELRSKQERMKATTARYRILRFADELYRGDKHSKEHFDSILHDITDYNLYCNQHPDFVNNMTLHAESYIEKTYDERLERGDFL